MKHALAVLCVYEVAAIVTHRVPTVTDLCGRWPWLGPLLVIAGAVHLAIDAERRAVPA